MKNPSYGPEDVAEYQGRFEDTHANGSLKLWLASFAEMFFDEKFTTASAI